MNIEKPQKVTQEMITPHNYFPGNPYYPLLIYRHVFSEDALKSPHAIRTLLKQNGWINSWIDGVYDFHHYHSQTHEVLIGIAGTCQVLFGGDKGPIHSICLGDVVILPAGVAHKSLTMSKDFKCIGAYPGDIEVDMQYGTQEEYVEAVASIRNIGLPENDPVFGEKGLLFNYWK